MTPHLITNPIIEQYCSFGSHENIYQTMISYGMTPGQRSTADLWGRTVPTIENEDDGSVRFILRITLKRGTLEGIMSVGHVSEHKQSIIDTAEQILVFFTTSPTGVA
jgi:hypothetical protein